MSFSGQDFVNYLKQYIGTPYVWGGNSLTGGIDCSGLTQQGLAHFGVNIGRVTNDQIGYGKAVDMDNLQVGDLVFFDTDPGRAGTDHVGVYAGNGMMIHAPRPGKGVEMTSLTQDYYASRFMGGRRMTDMIDDGSGPVASPETVARLSPEEMSSKYGYAYAFMTSEPELKGIFEQAVAGTWDDAKFKAAVQNTTWWKNNADVTRQAQMLKKTDPATFSASVDAAKAKIAQMAVEAGAAITDAQLAKIADDAVMFGMDDGRINGILSNYIDFVGGTLRGAAGLFEHNMRQFAGDMGVDLSDQALKNQAALITRGMSTQDDFQNFIRDQASSSFPAFAEQIKGGQTMKSIANPYIQMMAQQLEMNPSAIKIKDPTIMFGLNGLDRDGNPTGRSLTDFQDSLRGDPRWRSTDQAMKATMNVGNNVLKQMGLIG